MQLQNSSSNENFFGILHSVCLFFSEGFFESGNSKIESEFHRLADSLKDQYRFAHTYNNRLLIRYGYRK